MKPDSVSGVKDWQWEAFVQGSLSQLALSLHNCDDSEALVRELLFTAMGLFGCGSGAVYAPVGGDEKHLKKDMGVNCAVPEELRIDPGTLDKMLQNSAWQLPDGLPSGFEKGIIIVLHFEQKLEGILWLGVKLNDQEWTNREKEATDDLAAHAAQALAGARIKAHSRNLSKELDRRLFQLLTLFEAGKEIHSFANWELLTKNLLYTAMGNLGIREGGLLALQETGGVFRIWHARGLRPAKLVESFHLAPGDPLMVFATQAKRSLRREEIEKALPQHEVLLLAFEVLVPGVSSRGVEFLLVLGSKLNQTPFTDDEIEYLSILCSQAAVVFENRDLVKQNIQAERLAAIGQAMAGLGHDFRGVLNGLSGASRHLAKMVAELSDGRSVDTEMLRRWWSVIRANEKRLNDLVEDIVEYSKPRSPVREPCQINRLVEDLATQREEELVARKVQLSLDLATSLPMAKVDTTRFFRVLSNLVDNACDAVAEGTGKVELRTRMQHDALVVEVRDNGVGIETENMSRIFDPLFTTKKGSRGTGFGLANVKKIIEEHGGQVKVLSRLHHGTTFRIEIPLRESSFLLEAAEKQDRTEEVE